MTMDQLTSRSYQTRAAARLSGAGDEDSEREATSRIEASVDLLLKGKDVV